MKRSIGSKDGPFVSLRIVTYIDLHEIDSEELPITLGLEYMGQWIVQLIFLIYPTRGDLGQTYLALQIGTMVKPRGMSCPIFYSLFHPQRLLTMITTSTRMSSPMGFRHYSRAKILYCGWLTTPRATYHLPFREFSSTLHGESMRGTTYPREKQIPATTRPLNGVMVRRGHLFFHVSS